MAAPGPAPVFELLSSSEEEEVEEEGPPPPAGSALRRRRDALRSHVEALRARERALAAERSRAEAELAALDRELRDREAREAADRARRDWGGAFPAWDRAVEAALTGTFGLAAFRPCQREAINAVLSGRDTLCLMPAGGGKSLTYQIPAVVASKGLQGPPDLFGERAAGFALVISPLLSLIEDQVAALRARGVAAAALTSATPKAAQNQTLQDMKVAGALTLLYVTPERFSKSKRFLSNLEKAYGAGLVALFAVDEAHCLSQWGHDFRTDYQSLVLLKRQFRKVPVLALTATATRQCVQDVKKMLNIPHCEVFHRPVDRANLFYEVALKPHPLPDAAKFLFSWITTHFDHRRASGLVYCFSKKESEDVARALRAAGVAGAFYHADVEPQRREEVHRAWAQGRLQVICATVAFGMGINKVDVRYVIHFTLSKAMEGYYQESGRAGRDGKPSRCLLLYRPADVLRVSALCCTEARWPHQLHGMVRYAQMEGCRRRAISGHFGETTQCERGCDLCRGDGTATLARFDGPQALEAANGLLELLDAAKDRQERLTLNKLADKFKKHKVAKALGRPQVELLVIALLVAGVLKEDLGWTAYATTSYLVNGLGHGRRCTDEPDLRYVAYGGGAGPSKKRKASA